ncbi:MAG: alpha/beta hydrolase [Algiphilus sp.]
MITLSSRRTRWFVGLIALFVVGCSGSSLPEAPAGSDAPDETSSTARFSSVAPSAAEPKAGVEVSDAVPYRSAAILVSDPSTGLQYNADVEGQVRYPLEGGGPLPVILYLHGRHATCVYGDGTEFLSPGVCPDFSDTGAPLVLTQPIDNFKGYDYMADTLASHGYVVISIDANDVNDKDLAGDAGVNARSQLILHHLDIFRSINTDGSYPSLAEPEAFISLKERMDFDRIGLMGHSRGGQAVSHVHFLNLPGRQTTEVGLPSRQLADPFTAPHSIKAVFALAPTNFDYITAPDTTYAVLLPYCDGDVSNLQGAFLYDDSRYVAAEKPAAKFQILTKGGNHNYYNTKWTGEAGNGDDYTNADSWCDRSAEGNGRDSPAAQRAHGEFLMSSFFRLFVGGETDFKPYWQGRAHLPADACPEDTEGFCDDRVLLSIQMPEAKRIVINDALTPERLTTNNLAGNQTVEGFERAEFCTTKSTEGTNDADGCPSVRTFANTGQLFLQWKTAGASFKTELGGLDASSKDFLSLRVGVAFNAAKDFNSSDKQDFRLVLTDKAGNSKELLASEYGDALFVPPGDADNGEGAKTTLNMLLFPLKAFAGVDPSQLDTLKLIFDQSMAGAIQIADLQFQNAPSP